jgi:hypothetical protein
MSSVINALADGVPKALVELRKLGRTLARRVCDVLPTSTDRAPATDPQKP